MPRRAAERLGRERLRDTVGGEPQPLEPRTLALQGRAPGTEGRIPRVVHDSERVAGLGEAQLRVVLPETQSILGPAREHPVRFARPERGEVVGEDPDVRLVAPGGPRLAPGHPPRRVEARDEPLGGRLLVPGRAVDLAREEEAVHRARLERRAEIPGVEVVVLDGVARPGDDRVLEALDRAHQLVLDIERQARRDAVRVHLRRVEALRLDEDPVRGPCPRTAPPCPRPRGSSGAPLPR